MDYHYLFFIRKSVRYTEQERKYLSILLFKSVYNDEFHLNRAFITLSFLPKVQRSFNKVKRSFNINKSKSQLLICYALTIKLPRIYTDLIQILASTEDKDEYDFLTKNEKYLIIGNSRIGKLAHPQTNYINRLIETQFSTSIISQKSKSQPLPCNHYKSSS